jgi:hypothetical protein
MSDELIIVDQSPDLEILEIGSPGPTGAQGIQGATGATGAQGIQGDPGPTYVLTSQVVVSTLGYTPADNAALGDIAAALAAIIG